jgi:hypothetical protein
MDHTPFVEHPAEESVKQCIRSRGARCPNGRTGLESFSKDLDSHVRHDYNDHVLAMNW